MLFQQTTAPVGWTKQTAHNDKALRVVSGTASSGGSTAFSSVFTSRTLAQANLPNINLSSASLTLSDTRTWQFTQRDPNNSETINYANGGNSATVADNVNVVVTITASSPTSGSLSLGGNVPLGGSDTALDFAVAYVDLIIAAKD